MEKIPVLIIDKNLNIVYLNEYARSIYGNKTGEKCFKTLKGKNSPCTVHCPVINQENIVIAGRDRCIDAVNCKEKTLYKILRGLNETVALSVDEKDILKKFCSVLSQEFGSPHILVKINDSGAKDLIRCGIEEDVEPVIT